MKGGSNLAPRTGRPKTENPRTEKVMIYLTEEDRQRAEVARDADKKPERSFSTWLARKVSEMLRKLKK